MIGRDAPWIGRGDFFADAIEVWNEQTRGGVDDLLAAGPDAFLDLAGRPAEHGGLEDGEVVALAGALVARCLTEGSPPRELVAEVGAALHAAAARSKTPRRFEPPAGYLSRDRGLLIVLLCAACVARGRRAGEGEP